MTSIELKNAANLLLIPFLLTLWSCGSDSVAPNPELEGGVLATFRVEAETFQFWTANAATIQDLLELQAGESEANIPNGPLLPGPGRGDHNAPFSWHLDPNDTEMAENTIEVCSGLPSFVEEEIGYWLTLGRYCPWSAELVALEDFR